MKNQNFIFIFFFIFSVILINGQEKNKIILKLKTETSDGILNARKVSHINKLFSSYKTQQIILSKKDNNSIYIVEFPEKSNIQKIIQEYYKTGEIEYAEPDYPIYIHGESQLITPNDPYYSRQWGLHNDGTFSLLPSIAGADIDMEKAWEIEQGNNSIIVAVIDTGAKIDHPEFSNRIWDGKGWNFADNNNDLFDNNGHGTNVAGIIGANSGNAIGYTGIDWNCKLMIIKVFSSTGNGGTTSTLASAIHYAVNKGARVINLSLGGKVASTTLKNSIEYALQNNVVVVASMGNDNTGIINYPAAFPGVIAVGSINPNNHRSQPFYKGKGGSNYGDHISVVAPGNAIYGLSTSNTNYSLLWSGTSQAAPHVTGLVSLLLAQNPNRTPSEIKKIIEETAEDQIGNPTEDLPGWDKYYGFGKINAFNALSKNMSIENPNNIISQINIYPNPAKENFTCNFPKDTKQIHIFNSLGQLIISKPITGSTSERFQINESGIYFIQFTLENRNKVTKKIIISK